MATSSLTPTTGKGPNLAAGILVRFGAIVATLAVQALLLFGGAGTLHWPWAWVYFDRPEPRLGAAYQMRYLPPLAKGVGI